MARRAWISFALYSCPLLIGLTPLMGCSKAIPSTDGPSDPSGSPKTLRIGAPSASTAKPAAPAPKASDPAPAPAASSAPPPAESAKAPEPLPKVKVWNIGMHIGGGPNDRRTKAPIKESVSPHYDDFKRCFGKLEDQTKGGDFGVDLRIERAGGKAKVSHPRSALKGKEFRACVVEVFEKIDFKKPRTGTTVVSYSLRFRPLR